MKNRIVMLGCLAALLSGTSSAQAHWLFKDIDAVPWAVSSIISGYHRNIVVGVGGDLYHPQADVTRAQFIKMLVMTDRYTFQPGALNAKDPWWTPYIAHASQPMGVLDEAIKKEPMDKPITRLEIARLIGRFLDKSYRGGKAVSDDKLVGLTKDRGILQGRADGDLALDQNVTRAEAAVIMERLFQLNNSDRKNFDTPSFTRSELGTLAIHGIHRGIHREQVQKLLGPPFKVEDLGNGEVYEEYFNFYVSYQQGKAIGVIYKSVSDKLLAGEEDLPGAAVFEGYGSVYYYFHEQTDLLMIKDKKAYLGYPDGNFYFGIDQGAIKPLNEAAEAVQKLKLFQPQ